MGNKAPECIDIVNLSNRIFRWKWNTCVNSKKRFDLRMQYNTISLEKLHMCSILEENVFAAQRRNMKQIKMGKIRVLISCKDSLEKWSE